MSQKWEELVEQALQDLRSETPRKEMSKIEDEVFDKPTMRALSKLISHGHIDTVDYCMSTGKEANVFRATTPEGAHVAAKIYRVHTSSFRSHEEYIWGDPRFKAAGASKREIVSIWANKEFKNLSRFLDAGCRVPTPITVRDNVLLMEFVGEEGLPAPTLHKVQLDESQPIIDTLVRWVKRAWQDGTLVHGDLSEYNVMVMPEELVVIDTAQSVVSNHPRARELLDRDVDNLVRYAKKKGLDPDREAMMDEILEDDEPDDENGGDT